MAATDLVDLGNELKPFLGIPTSDLDKDELLDSFNAHARALIESALDRHLVTRGALTEYHSIDRHTHRIYLTQYPVISITSVHESAALTYDATTLLTSGTDYLLADANAGALDRISGGGPIGWLAGYRVIQVVYSAGYADTSSVPEDIKYQCKRLIGTAWSEATRKEFGLSSVADDMGNISRFFPPGLNASMRDALEGYRRRDFSSTAEGVASS